MHFINTLGVAIMAIAATSANPLPEAEAEPTLILPTVWCKKWDSYKGCCVDDDKPGCTIYLLNKCITYKKNWWCNSYNYGKGCCDDKEKDKEGCVKYDYKGEKCEEHKKEGFCDKWDWFGFYCKDGGVKEGCDLWNWEHDKCDHYKEKYWCYKWSKDEGCCKDKDGGKKDCIEYDTHKKECSYKKGDK